MATITKIYSNTTRSGQLRPFDVRRDLTHVADLIEQCFADTLDPEGQRYLQQMRSAAGNPGYLQWMSFAAERTSLPLNGYVWEEDGKVVGNLTLIPSFGIGRRYYLIANVATHPDYRRRGIARQLTTRAVEHARQRGAQAAWLHVRAENAGAIALYTAIGFVERARRTTWQCNEPSGLDPVLKPEVSWRVSAPSDLTIGKRLERDWPSQKAWLETIYPRNVTWHLPIRLRALHPGFWGAFYRMWNDVYVQQWSALHGRRLEAVLAWQSLPGYTDSLWLATGRDCKDEVVSALLMHARRQLSLRRPLSLDFPAGQAVGAIEIGRVPPTPNPGLDVSGISLNDFTGHSDRADFHLYACRVEPDGSLQSG